jgi:alcohol dehydrogenase class IV
MSTFRHVDAARTIVFGAGAVERALDLIGSGFTLLTTERVRPLRPELSELAGKVVIVPNGYVEEVAADLRAEVDGANVIAFGGGRVIDVGKALTAADPPRRLTAIPTTVSAAEMTGRHRHAAGVPQQTPYARAAIVVNDPSLSASQPAGRLAASSANALGHATAALLSERATPVSDVIAAEAVARLKAGWAEPGREPEPEPEEQPERQREPEPEPQPEPEPERPEVALGALLAGWAVDLTGIGLHHVLAQTAVRTIPVSHADANAALLPFTLAAMSRRRPGVLERLNGDVMPLAISLRERSGPSGLRALAEDESLLERAVEAAGRRAELAHMPAGPDGAELRELYLAAAR